MTISEWEMLFRIIVAIFLGGAIGYEREVREVPAGLRTHMIVALASSTFALVSFHVAFFQHYPTDVLTHFDAGRIASNIVVGIGFLGGGAILHSGITIKGLTSAASLWLTAAIGLAAGGGMLLLAVAATVMCLFALVVLRYAIELPRKKIVRLSVQIDLEGDFLSREALVKFLEPVGAVVTAVEYQRDFTDNHSRMEMNVRLPGEEFEEPLMKRLEELPGLRRVNLRRLD